jgi:predicted phosphohydrolase
MKIQYVADLHLEFNENSRYLQQIPIVPVGDILILAGDIVPFAVMDKFKDFFDYCSDNFVATYWIPGNHEYYYFDIVTKSGVLNENIRSNVHLVNNVPRIQNDTKLIFSTLWSKIQLINQWQIEQNMSDFHVIRRHKNRFTASDYNQLHEESLNFITSELQNNTQPKSIVVSHHVPTFLNYPAQYKGSILNEAFAVELFDLIESIGPDYWIYGHNHCNTNEFKIGKTTLLTNQLGYVKYKEHETFNPKLYFNI